MLLELVLCVFCILLIYTYKKQYCVEIDFPMPPQKFLTGHTTYVSSGLEAMNIALDWHKKLGPTFQINMGPIASAIFSVDHKFAKTILGKSSGTLKGYFYNFFNPWIGNGLLTSNGAKWKRMRKILTPTFHFGILKDSVSVFESVGDVLIAKLEEYDGTQSFDVEPLISLCALDIICESAMNTKLNSLNGQNTEYVHAVKEISRIVMRRLFSVLKYAEFTFILTKDFYTQRKLLKILHSFRNRVIEGRKKQLHEINSDFKEKATFLDLLLSYRDQNGEVLTDREIQDEVDTFMFEGHDTVSACISFTLFALANHADVQTNVLKEQEELFGKTKNPTITYQELQEMKYLDNVIKESLRLYPSIPILTRRTVTDLVFNNNVLGKNVELILFAYGMHQNPEYFPNPEKFDPDRFNSFDGTLSYAYIPFSAGERNCIGQKYAMLEIKSIISKVVRHFELKPAFPKHVCKLAADIVLTSVNGVKIGLNKRS